MVSSRIELSLFERIQAAKDVLLALLVTAFYILKAVFNHFMPPAEKSVKGEVVLVTGAGQGIGRALAHKFSECGATVVCWDINEATNSSTVKELRSRARQAFGYTCDVSSREQIFKAAQKVREEVGDVTILVNNAGWFDTTHASLCDIQESYIRKMFEVNLLSQFWTVQAFLPRMLEKDHGHIVGISSMTGLTGLPKMIPYCTSKFGVTGFMDSLAKEISAKTDNVKVTCVHPYLTLTRSDILENIESSVPPCSVDFAAEEIISGVRQNLEVMTVPRNLLLRINISRILPCEAKRKWREVFYIRERTKTAEKQKCA